MATAVGVEPTYPAGPILCLWMAVGLALNASLWASGAGPTALGGAVDSGAARVESRAVGEESDDVIRKAIRLQHDSLPFWKALALFGDFALLPLSLAFRAVTVAAIFGGLAALMGRPIGFARGLHACALAQGFWVLGLAVRAALAIALRRPGVETSATLFLPPGNHPAAVWVVLGQLDVFAGMGWVALARGGWRRRQVGPVAALLVCGVLWAVESMSVVAVELVIGAGMRLSLMPEV